MFFKDVEKDWKFRLNGSIFEKLPAPTKARCIASGRPEDVVASIYEIDEHTKVNLIPKVGMGATEGVGSDSYPYTVVKVSQDDKTIEVQADNYTPAEGHDYISNQVYNYTPNPQGKILIFTLRKNGRWVQKGEAMHNGTGLGLGHRRAYSDPSF